MALDIRTALADLEDQKAKLLETIAQLTKTREDLLLPDAVAKVREELRVLEIKRDAANAEIERAKPLAKRIIDEARQTASELVNKASGESHAAIVNAKVAADDVRAKSEALLVNAEKVMAGAKLREQEVADRSAALDGVARELANRRGKLVPLLRSLAAELEREIV